MVADDRTQISASGFLISALPPQGGAERVAIGEDSDSGDGLCLRTGATDCGDVIHALDF